MSLHSPSKGPLFSILPDSEDSSSKGAAESKESSASDATISTPTANATLRSRFCSSSLWCNKLKARSRAACTAARSRPKKPSPPCLLPEDEVAELKQAIERLAQKVHSDNETMKTVIRESLASAKSSASSSTTFFSSAHRNRCTGAQRHGRGEVVGERSSSVSVSASATDSNMAGPQGERRGGGGRTWQREKQHCGVASTSTAVLGALNEVNEALKAISKDILQTVDMPIRRSILTDRYSAVDATSMMRVLTEIKDGVNALDRRLRESSGGGGGCPAVFKEGRPFNQTTDYLLRRKLEEIRETLHQSTMRKQTCPPAPAPQPQQSPRNHQSQAWNAELLSELTNIRKSLRSLEEEERQPTLTHQLSATGTPYMLISRR